MSDDPRWILSVKYDVKRWDNGGRIAEEVASMLGEKRAYNPNMVDKEGD